jgi:arylsulfatase A-like enzyme
LRLELLRSVNYVLDQNHSSSVDHVRLSSVLHARETLTVPAQGLAMFRLLFPLSLFLIAAMPAKARSETRPPNILVILTDDQGYQDLGCFGSPRLKTPNLDRMAREGLRLTSFYAQPVCGVSRAALMTGSYPIRVGEPGNAKRLHTEPHTNELTIAEVLKAAGYDTACLGKWHLGTPSPNHATGFDPATMPNGQGFDYFYGTPKFNGASVHVRDIKFRSSILRNQEVVVREVLDWNDITADYTREALRWLERKRDKPFFLYLAHNMPHVPLGASERFRGKSAAGPYGDAIEEIDWSCGEIFATLKQLGLDDNTLIVFTSDNGPWIETTKGMQPNSAAFIPRDHAGYADPLRGWKMSGWEGGSRVPCLVRWTGKIPANRVSDELTTAMDLLPTFASLAGAKLPSDLVVDGHDLNPFLSGKTERSPRAEYFYYAGCRLLGVRDSRWKLVLPRPAKPEGLFWWSRMIDAVGETELYDLTADIGETKNVAKLHPEIVNELMKRIARAREELGDHDRTGKGARFFDTGPRRVLAN